MSILSRQDKTEMLFDKDYLLIVQTDSCTGEESTIAICKDMVDVFIKQILAEQKLSPKLVRTDA